MQPLHRITDPWTSRAAADSVKMKIAGLEQVVVDEIAPEVPAALGEIQEPIAPVPILDIDGFPEVGLAAIGSGHGGPLGHVQGHRPGGPVGSKPLFPVCETGSADGPVDRWVGDDYEFAAT